MAKLILIKHSAPEITPSVPANQWVLSEEGRTRCQRLASDLAEHRTDVVLTSVEPKAIETGNILAESWKRPCRTAEGLHEHERGNEDWFDSVSDFNDAVRNFFENPDSRVFGRESADEAHERFFKAVRQVVEEKQGQNVAVVAHGTVIALFTARLAGLDEFTLWRELGLPSYIILSLPGYGLEKVVKRL